MNRTKIEWVKNPDGTQGYTWNPITGCLNHVNGMCKGGNFPCYAYRLAHGRLKARYLANKNVSHTYFPSYETALTDPFYPRFWSERLRQLGDAWDRRTWHKTVKGIFVCDMSDLFGVGIPEEWTRKVLSELSDTPHRFYLLTKQPQNLVKFSPFPDNCWVGVTATDYESFYFGATKYLAKIKAKVKYISFEPLLEGMGKHIGGWLTACMIDAGINWLIIGSQTKPYKPPKIEWVQEIVEAADKAGIPVFLKDNLRPLLLDKQSGYMRKPYAHNQFRWKLRQEMPIGE